MSYINSENHWRNRFDKDPTQYALFVAEDVIGRVVGFADGGPERTGDTVYDGQLVRETHHIEIGGQQFQESAYGWANLERLEAELLN